MSGLSAGGCSVSVSVPEFEVEGTELTAVLQATRDRVTIKHNKKRKKFLIPIFIF